MAAGTSAELRDAIRNVLSEEANKRRADANRIGYATNELRRGASVGNGGNGASSPMLAGSMAQPTHTGANAAPDERFRALRDRIATLEDVLVKSEADRQAVYERCESATRALTAAQDERTALIHGLHEAQSNSANAVELEAAHREVVSLRDQVRQLTDDNAALHVKLDESERAVKTLKKEKKRILAETDGVSLADLHYSNERLSAQLTQLQRQQQQQESESRASDANRIAELDMAVRTLTNELAAIEQRVASSRMTHEDETRRLREQLDRQYRDFALERAECDSVVSAMGSKMEAMSFRIDALLNENASLRQQVSGNAVNSSAHAAGYSPSASHAGAVPRHKR